MNRRIAREGRGWRMPREDRTWLIVALEPLFWLFVHFLYPLLFGWWADKALARKHQRRLARDIRKALPFLFERYNGRIVPTEGVRFPPGFDYADVTVSLDTFLIHFSRGRNEHGVSIAPSSAPTDWSELSLVLAALDAPEDVQLPIFDQQGFFDLSEVAVRLEPHMVRLNELFSQGTFDAVKQRLERQVYSRERAAKRDWQPKDWQAEIDKRRYGR